MKRRFVEWRPETENLLFEGFASNQELFDAARRLERYLAKLKKWNREDKRKRELPPRSAN